MEHNKDPDTEHINNVCKNLIGAKIKFNFNITLLNGTTDSGVIENCNIVGDCMENILLPYLRAKILTIETGPKQGSPDFWNRNRKYEWELKVFKITPGFDISNFTSYIDQLNKCKGVERKIYRTQYLIFKYSLNKTHILIEDFKLCSVWNLLLYSGKYPISLQNKKGTWYTIRPCAFNDISYFPEYNNNKSPNIFIKQICKSILECPNKLDDIGDKDKIVKNIELQFHKLHFAKCLDMINNLYIL